MKVSNAARTTGPRVVRLGLMWMIGGPLIAFFGIGGAVFWMLAPGIGIGQIWVAVAAVLLIIYGSITASVQRRRAHIERVRRDGLSGFATVLEAEGTGVSVNRRPQVRLRLRVEVPGRAPYEVQLREVLPYLGLESIGPRRRVPVYVDRVDPTSVVIDWDGLQSSATMGPAAADTDPVAARLEKLQDLHRRGLISELELEAQRQRILDQV